MVTRFHISYRIFRSSAKVKFFNAHDYCWMLKSPTSSSLQLVSHSASLSYLIACSPNKCEVLKQFLATLLANVIQQSCQSVEIETGGNHPFSYPSCKPPTPLLTLLSAQQNGTPCCTKLHPCQLRGIVTKHLIIPLSNVSHHWLNET